jgi:hypothetical protein
VRSAPDGARGRSRALLVAAACVAVLVGLLAWPQAAPQPSDDADGGGEGLLAWPARGPLSEDAGLLSRAAAAWREAAAAGRVPAPGPDVQALYLAEGGNVDASVVVASQGDDGQPLVAVGRQTGTRVSLLSVERVEGTPPAVLLPAAAGVQLLLPPSPRTMDLAVRRADGIWQVVEARADGVTAPVRNLTDDPLVLGLVGSSFGQRGLTALLRLDPTRALPQPDQTGVTTPRWGRSTVVTPEEYDAAASVVPLVPRGSRVAVLASAGVPGARTVLAEVTRPGAVEPYLVLAASDGGNVLTGPRPVRRDDLAVGVLPRPDGRTLVLVGAAPAVARVEVRDDRGTLLVGGTSRASVVLPAPAPASLRVLGYGADGSVLTRVGVAVPGRGDDTGGTGGSGSTGDDGAAGG